MLKVIPQDLSRAVLNVMNNACYAVYSKSKLSPIGYEPVISVDLRKEGDSLRLSIEDNGIGMPEDIRELAPIIRAVLSGQSICAIGNAEKVKANQALFKTVKNLFN